VSEASFLKQIQTHQGILFKLVSLYARNQEEKKDLYQEILFQAWRGYDSFRGDSKFSTWLYKVCLNTIFTFQKKEARMRYAESTDENLLTVENQAETREDFRRLHAAICTLSEIDRAIVSLHLDGFSHIEIAQIIGISANNTTVKLHRIRTQLGKLLKPI
jgi:RNA polymerase sigma-70 factor, ECF subfamily